MSQSQEPMHNFFRFVMSRSCHRHEIELTNPFCFRHRGLLTVRLLSILSFLHCVLPTQSQPMEDSQFFKELLNQGAVWKPEEGLLTEVPYGPLEEHKLDVYFPQGDSSATKDASIWMHIHGGGWSRGAKDSEFYGGPGKLLNSSCLVAYFVKCCSNTLIIFYFRTRSLSNSSQGRIFGNIHWISKRILPRIYGRCGRCNSLDHR